MRILTHNMMVCLKCDHFPLKINATNKQEEPQDENLDFIKHMLIKLDYDALKSAANDLAIAGLPDTLPDNIYENEAALKSLHKLLLEVTIVEGDLHCPNCQRSYPIKNKIANMVLREDELAEKQKKSKSASTATTSDAATATATMDDE